jgi:phosphatidate phosphatase PAH1
MSPDGLMKSFKREVIYKRPEEFKTRAINDVRSLFSYGLNLYAGFGNRDTVKINFKNSKKSL